MASTEVVNCLLKGPQDTCQYTVWEGAEQTAHMVTTDRQLQGW